MYAIRSYYVPNRRALSREIRQEDDTFAARRHLFGKSVEKGKGGSTFLERHPPFEIRKLALKPSHRAAAACGATLQQPVVWYNMVSENETLIRAVLIDANANAARLTALLLSLPRARITS